MKLTLIAGAVLVVGCATDHLAHISTIPKKIIHGYVPPLENRTRTQSVAQPRIRRD
jgi:hypothetical protein